MRIACRNLNLDIKAPLSKSVYHRELIINFMLGARGDFLDDSGNDNDDIRATKSCLRALENTDAEEVILNCNESGSTLRFMIPVSLAAKSSNVKKLIFRTRGRLIDRPIKELADCLAPFGVEITKNAEANEITVTGNIEPGRYVIDGSVSSQYISGLLMALSCFDKESVIEVTGGIASVHYIELTTDALAKYGINIVKEGDTYKVPAKSINKAADGNFEVEGDWSNGAFLLCLKEFSDITVTNLNPDSRQGDRAILDFLAAERGGEITWDCTDIPDITPYMAVVAAFFFEKAVFTGIARLRIKESDRVKAVREQLEAIGVKTEETDDTLTVYGYKKDSRNAQPAELIKLSSYNDHRMAMCAVLIAAILKTDIELDNIDCMRKSFPEFIDIVNQWN